MRLTIAQFTFGLGLGGQERVVVDLARAFQKKGHRSLVCTTQYGGPLVRELEEFGIPFHCLDLRVSYDPGAISKVIRYLRENGADIVVTHGASGCYVPRLAAIVGSLPVIMHVEHSVSNSKRLYHLIIGRSLARFVDTIVCVSEHSKQSLLKYEKIREEKVIVIRNGVDSARFDGAGCHLEARQKIRIVIVANFSEAKGHIYFVEAMRTVVQENRNVEFVFVGDGELRPIIEEKVSALGLAEYCRFLGYRSDVGDVLQTCDIFALPSVVEGLPISLIEAQFCGLACIATAVGGIPEVIEDGYNGLLVPPRNTSAMTAGLLKIIYDESLRNRLGRQARQVALENFSARRMADDYIEKMLEILNRKQNMYSKQRVCNSKGD